MAKPTILCVGDTHFPFTNRKSLDAILKIANVVKPKIIVQIGDLLDLYSYSRFARTQNFMTPQQEVTQGRKMAEEMWASLRIESRSRPHKKVDCYQLLGNHDARLIRQTQARFPEIEHIVSGTTLWQFPGVTTMGAERDELVLEDICFMHGYLGHGDHVKYNQISTVVGHSHVGGVVYTRVANKVLFELNCGFIADTTSVPLSYTKQKKFSRHTQGVGLIDEYGPRFIPLE